MKRTSVLMELFYGPHLLTGKCITPKGRSNFEICCKTWFRPPTLWFGEEIRAILPRSCKVYSYIQFQGKQNNLGPAMSTVFFCFYGTWKQLRNAEASQISRCRYSLTQTMVPIPKPCSFQVLIPGTRPVALPQPPQKCVYHSTTYNSTIYLAISYLHLDCSTVSIKFKRNKDIFNPDD